MSSRKQKILAAALIAIALIGMAAGAAFGYLSAQTGPVQNTFTPGQEKDPSIGETFNGTEKRDVYVNVGNPGYAVYVRAAIVVTWEDEHNNVHSEMPQAGVDYAINLNETDWFYNSSDGFYYHKAMVNSGNTSVLIRECTQTLTAPSGYQLHVEIIAQTIQARGTTDSGNTPAVTDAWKISVDSNNNLVDPNP